jgi:ribosomal protein L7/L12
MELMETLKALALVAKHFPHASAAVALAFLSDLEERVVEAVKPDLSTFHGQVSHTRTFTKDNGYTFDYRDQKIQAIKEIRGLTGLGLKESKEVADTAHALHKKDAADNVSPAEWNLIDRYHWSREDAKTNRYSEDSYYDDEPPF